MSTFTGKSVLCIGHTYRGTTIVDVSTGDQTYALVIGTPHPASGQAVMVYPCNNRDEAKSLVDAAYLLNPPVRESGVMVAPGLMGLLGMDPCN